MTFIVIDFSSQATHPTFPARPPPASWRLLTPDVGLRPRRSAQSVRNRFPRPDNTTQPSTNWPVATRRSYPWGMTDSGAIKLPDDEHLDKYERWVRHAA